MRRACRGRGFRCALIDSVYSGQCIPYVPYACEFRAIGSVAQLVGDVAVASAYGVESPESFQGQTASGSCYCERVRSVREVPHYRTRVLS